MRLLGRVEELGKPRSDRNTETGARIGADFGAEEPVIAARDIGEHRLVRPELGNHHESELASERSEETGIKRGNGACAPDDSLFVMHEDLVSRVGIGVGGHIGHHAASTVRRIELPIGHGLEEAGEAAARSVPVRVSRLVVPDGLGPTSRLVGASAGRDIRARGRQVDIGRKLSAIRKVIVASGSEDPHAIPTGSLCGVVELAGEIDTEVSTSRPPIRLIGTPGNRANIATVSGGCGNGHGHRVPVRARCPVHTDLCRLSGGNTV